MADRKMEDQIWGEVRRRKMEDRKMQDPTTGMENAGTNNYAENNKYNHSQLLKSLSPIHTGD